MNREYFLLRLIKGLMSIARLMIILCFCIVFFQNCQERAEGLSEAGLAVIDIESSFLNRGEIELSSLGVEEVEYVRLETIEESLIGAYSRTYVDKDYIYSVAFRQIKLFNRLDGKFIRELGHYGQDPEGYTNTLPYTRMSDKGEILVRRGNDIYGLDSVNAFVKRFTPAEGVSTFAEIDDSVLVGFRSNYDCAQEKRVSIFDLNGEELNFFPNYQECDNNLELYTIYGSEGMFYKSLNRVFLKETFNDTLFQVDAKNMEPLAVFNLGRFGHSYEMKNFFTEEERFNHAIVGDISYMDGKILFSLYLQKRTFHGVYDSKLNTTMISQVNRDKKVNGFTNDVDGFVGFRPSYLEGADQLVGKTEAEEVYEWLQNNPDKISTLPKKLQDFKDIQPEDNPIVMIVKLK